MDPKLAAKLRILADAAKYDASCASSGAPKRSGGKTGLGSTSGMGICHAYTPDGRCVSLLKILLTNWCLYDCAYCVNRRSSNTPRARFTVEEVVTLTLEFYKRNYIEGLFLSSGVVKSPDHTMEELLRVARTLRRDHGFAGYIHLKAIPEASPWLIEQAGRWADRLSINLELPPKRASPASPPRRRAPSITAAMGQMHERITEAKAEKRRFAPAGQSTQVIVGADDTTDASVLAASARLYDRLRPPPRLLLRLQPDPRAERRRCRSSRRRSSARTASTRPTGCCASTASASRRSPPAATHGMLDLDADPKLAWALKHRDRFPVDINRAPRELLLRVPGLGTTRRRPHPLGPASRPPPPRRPRAPVREPTPRRRPSSSPPTTGRPASTGSTCAAGSCGLPSS